MSRKIILSLAAAATLAVAMLSSHRPMPAALAAVAVSAAAAVLAAAAVWRIGPLHRSRRPHPDPDLPGPRSSRHARTVPARPSQLPRPLGLPPSSITATGVPLRPLDRRRRCGRRSAGAPVVEAGARPVHLPDQDLYAERPRGVRRHLHQGIRPARRSTAAPTPRKSRPRRWRPPRCQCRWCRLRRITPAALMRTISRPIRNPRSRRPPTRRLRPRKETKQETKNEICEYTS